MATTYDIHEDVKYQGLEVVEAGKLADACTVPWWNQSLTRVNDSVARIGVFHGEFHWHKHDREDELFFVLEGKLLLDVEGKGPASELALPRAAAEKPATAPSPPSWTTTELGPRQGMMVPRGIVHRTRALQRTVVLMVEAASVKPTGD